MPTVFWVVLGAVSWCAGFFQAGFSDEKGQKISQVFVRPPFLIYLLCGLPKASNIPKGVIALRSLMSQLQGILFLSYGIIHAHLPNQNFNLHMVIMFILINIIYLFCWLLYKRYPYSIEEH